VTIVATDLFAAVAKWSHKGPDKPHLGGVTFRDGEMYATDGHRMVRVPMETTLEVTIRRDHIQAAAAAQKVIRFSALIQNKRPVIEISMFRNQVRMDLGSLTLTVTPLTHDVFSRATLDSLSSGLVVTRGPVNYAFDPHLLAAISEVNDAACADTDGGSVKLLKWGSPTRGSAAEPILFEGHGGILFMIMPVHNRCL
jgi:hypothetical protein